jgi:hypothetical protein
METPIYKDVFVPSVVGKNEKKRKISSENLREVKTKLFHDEDAMDG